MRRSKYNEKYIEDHKKGEVEMRKLRIIILTCIAIASLQFAYSQAYEGPGELRPYYEPLDRHRLCASTDTIKCFYQSHFETKKIVLYWNFRPSAEHEWKAEIQELTTSYWVIDTWSHSENDLYVLGLSDTGKTIIERWNFVHKPFKWSMPPGGPATWSKDAPGVRRKELYNGTGLNHVVDLSGDLEGRFLLFMTLESREIYQMNPVTGDYFYLFGPSDLENIRDFICITSVIHETDGYIYILCRNPPWKHHRNTHSVIHKDGKTHIVSDHVIFRDSNKDGIIDVQSLEYFTAHDWVYSTGYFD
jgi:hypothetical protein